MSDIDVVEAQKRVVRALSDSSMLGARLMKAVGVHRPEDFVRVMEGLVVRKVVQASGALAPDKIAFAAFGMRPSERAYLSDHENLSRILATKI